MLPVCVCSILILSIIPLLILYFHLNVQSMFAQLWRKSKLCFFFQIVLDSDHLLFGGFNRLDHNAEYFSSVRKFTHKTMSKNTWIYLNFMECKGFHILTALLQDGWYDDRPHSFLIYAPCRTVVVYAPDEELEPVKGWNYLNKASRCKNVITICLRHSDS